METVEICKLISECIANGDPPDKIASLLDELKGYTLELEQKVGELSVKITKQKRAIHEIERKAGEK